MVVRHGFEPRQLPDTFYRQILTYPVSVCALLLCVLALRKNHWPTDSGLIRNLKGATCLFKNSFWVIVYKENKFITIILYAFKLLFFNLIQYILICLRTCLQ